MERRKAGILGELNPERENSTYLLSCVVGVNDSRGKDVFIRREYGENKLEV